VTVGNESEVGVGKGIEIGVTAAQAEEKHSTINRMNQTRIAIS
jgi:phosphoribosylformylglycinamidine (FGAM) synthase PurS component